MVCTLCKFGAIRFFFIYDEKNYVACGKYTETNDAGIDFCKLSDYYSDVWPTIYASNPKGSINGLYVNNTDGESYTFCQRNEDLINDYCTQEYGYPADWLALDST